MKVHIGMYISFLINLLISTCFISLFTNSDATALVLSLTVMAIFTIIPLSPLSHLWCKHIYGFRELNQMEEMRLVPIFKSVYEKVKQKSPKISSDIKLFISDDDSLNAMAVGNKMIVVNTGLLMCEDNELAGILSHEFAHIINGDAVATTMSAQSNTIAYILKTIMSFLIRFFGFLFAILLTHINDDDWAGIFVSWGIKCTDWIFTMYIGLIMTIGIVLGQYSSRQQEYAADTYACELGYARSLIDFFSQFPDSPSFKSSSGLKFLLYGTHPKNSDRIKNLQKNL